jgi:hypothetical protein
MPVDDTKFAYERVLFLKTYEFTAPMDPKTVFATGRLTELAM